MSEKSRVLLFASDQSVLTELIRHLWSGPFLVDTSSTVAGALVRVREFGPDVIVASAENSDGDELCNRIKTIDQARPVLLVFPPRVSQAKERAETVRSDGYLHRGDSGAALVLAVRLAVRLRGAESQISELQRRSDRQVLAPAPGLNESSKHELEFFKRAVSLEVRRSNRYHYPLALIAIGVDKFAQTLGRLQIHERTRVMGQLFQNVQRTIRDIDLAARHGAQRILVCLPQTDLAGARYLTSRLHDLERSIKEPKIALSIGVGSLDGTSDNVTFRMLFESATSRLRQAQSKGGSRVEIGAAITRAFPI